MTHDELKQKIADIAHKKDAHEARNDFLLPLLAVVKLHEPHKIVWTDYITEMYCATCSDAAYIAYPCETIQAIEKELR